MTLLASLRDWLKAQQLDAVLLSSRQNKQPHLGISTGSGYVVISVKVRTFWWIRAITLRWKPVRKATSCICLTQRTRLPLSSIKSLPMNSCKRSVLRASR